MNLLGCFSAFEQINEISSIRLYTTQPSASQVLVNLLGSFSAFEQIKEMRFNYWSAKLIQV